MLFFSRPRVQILKIECKYGQYRTLLSQSHYRYFFRVSDKINYTHGVRVTSKIASFNEARNKNEIESLVKPFPILSFAEKRED